jgi:cell division protease FtsH
MASGLEFMRLLGTDSSAYLGESTPWADIAEDTKAAADSAIGALLREAAGTAGEVLKKHRAALDLVAAELLEHETLEGVALLAVLDRAGQAMQTPPSGASRPRTRSRSG